MYVRTFANEGVNQVKVRVGWERKKEERVWRVEPKETRARERDVIVNLGRGGRGVNFKTEAQAEGGCSGTSAQKQYSRDI